MRRENIAIVDSKGVVYKGRKEGMDPDKQRYAAETSARTLADIVKGADVFLGLSAGGVLKPEMVKAMADKPLILAMANPEPEIRPELAKQVRPDCVIGTGRSDYPNQVNNSLCFPFIFRGALDCGASTINEEMKLATVHALAGIARAEPSEIVAIAYGQQTPSFGPDYLIPRAFDPRLITNIPPAVAKAAMESGVATRPIEDFDAYQRQLARFVYQSGTTMEPVFEAARQAPKRVVYAEGEDERVLRAVQVALDEGLAKPVLIGRPEVVAKRIQDLGLRIEPGENCELVNPATDDPRYRDAYREYHSLAERKGVSLQYARDEMRGSPTLIGAMLVRRGDADAMLCGVSGPYQSHLRYIDHVIGLRAGVENFAAMNMLMLPNRTLFICDTYVNADPTVEQISDMTVLAALAVRRFGLMPRVALLSHSNFGNADSPSARKMREAYTLITSRMPELEIEGEMQGNAALSKEILDRVFPNARLKGEANLLIMPNLDAANIAYTLLEVAAGGGITVGPILLGAAMPVHILTPTASVRRIVNMTALAVLEAASHREEVRGLG